MKTLRILSPIVCALLVMWIAVAPARGAESAADLLERGLYTEQTVGDLDAAIAIYQRVVDAAASNRPHIAQARYRLALCQLKQGHTAAARSALETLVREYADLDYFADRAREQLATIRPGLVKGSAPWLDGELLTYRLSLPNGQVIGSLFLGAESTIADGAEAWSFEVYRLLNSGTHFGVSRVQVDAETQRPIRSSVRHGVFGDVDAIYSRDAAELVFPTDRDAKAKGVVFERETFDNEQSMHLLRLLPLAPGYSTTLDYLVTWTGQVISTGLEVTGTETCSVPAGDFECHVVQLDVGQTYWVTTGTEQYPVKVQADGVTIELAAIEELNPDAPVAFDLASFDLHGRAPAGWRSHAVEIPERPNRGMVRLADPEATTISAVETYRCPESGCPSLERVAKKELAGAEKRFEDYTLRQSTWNERSLGGHPTVRFAGDYLQDGEPWVQYRLYTIRANVLLESIFRTPVEHFDALQAELDGIVGSLTIR